METRVSVRVYGYVQGVCFRCFTLDIARGLGLRGYVRNLPRGDAVEVEAEGDRQQLDKLLEFLGRGPQTAKVTQVEVRWLDYSGQFMDFSVKY
ncbi:MAG: acylphosphatase [Dehalococcoidia bacterium]|nr:acylphosphatase [Dehalococcoidia bacterium]